MPTATITFDLDDERDAFDAAIHGRKALSALWTIDQRCRSILKHGDPSPEAAALAGEIRDMIREQCPEALEI